MGGADSGTELTAATSPPRIRGVPWYVRQDKEEVAPDRIEAARQRLKQEIPPPEGEEP